MSNPSSGHIQGRPRKVADVTPVKTGPVLSSATSTDAAMPVFNYTERKVGKKNWLKRWNWKKIAIVVGALAAAGVAFMAVMTFLAAGRIITRNNNDGAPALSGKIDPSKLKSEGDGRVNVLLLGIGGAGHEGANLSDTILVASIDPRTKDVAMLGIPRDLYVPIPGYGSTKINAAHAYGEQKKSGEGPVLAKTVVSNILDLPIHYYVRVDFAGFKQAVDAVGGVDVLVEKAIYDPYYPDDKKPGLTKTFSIKAGLQHMNGETALKYSRSRYTTSDFDRASRQQKVLLALRQKALDLGTLLNPAKVLALINSIGNRLKTDVQAGEIKKLAVLVKEIDSTKIKQKVLDTSPDGVLVFGNIAGAGSIEVPRAGVGNFSEVRALAHSLFVDSYITEENASVEVQNGTTRANLAATVGKMLKGYNYNVTSMTTADKNNYPTTIIYDYSDGKKPYTVSYLEKRFGVKAQKASAPAAGAGDIRIIVGANYKAK